MHPYERGFKLISRVCRLVDARNDITTGNIDLVFKQQRDGRPGDRLLQTAIERIDARYGAGFSRGLYMNVITRT